MRLSLLLALTLALEVTASAPIDILDKATKADKAAVESYIRAGGSAALRDSDGRSLLMCAAAGGSLDIVKLVLQAKPSLNDTDHYGATALTWAVSGGNLEIIRTLNALGTAYSPRCVIWCDSSRNGAYWGSPVNIAAGRNEVPVTVLDYLLDSCGASVHEKEFSIIEGCDSGYAPIHWAAHAPDTVKASHLLKAGADINAYYLCEDVTPLVLSFRERNPVLIPFLLHHGARLDSVFGSYYESASPIAAMVLSDLGPRADSAIFLALNHGLKPLAPLGGDSMLTMLSLSVFGAGPSMDSLIALLRKSRQLPQRDHAAFHALVLKKPDALRALLEAGIRSPDLEESFPDAISELLTGGASDSITLKLGGLPGRLYWSGHTTSQSDSLALACLRILKDHGIWFDDMSVRNLAFMRATQRGFHGCMQLLIDDGVSPTCIPVEDANLMGLALANSDTLTMQLLARNGVPFGTSAFAAVVNPCSCATLAYAGRLARASTIPLDTRSLATHELLAAAVSGCVDRIEAALQQGAQTYLCVESRPGSDDGSVDTIYALERALRHPRIVELLLSLKGQRLSPPVLARLLMRNYHAIDTASFDAVLATLPGRLKKEVADELMEVVDNTRDPLVVHLLNRHGRLLSERSVRDHYVSVTSNPSQKLLDSLLAPQVLAGYSPKVKGYLFTGLLMAGDTVSAARLLASGAKIPGKRQLEVPLAVLVVESVSGDGLVFLRNHGIELQGRDLKTACSRFADNLNRQSDPRIAAFLLDAGADRSWQTSSGTPIAVEATDEGNFGVLRVLIEHGMEPDVATSDGRTPLTYAALAGDTALVSLLLRKGAHVSGHISSSSTTSNETAPDHNAALRGAANAGKSDVCRLLIAAGANPLTSSSDYPSALDAALSESHDSLALLMLDAVTPQTFHALDSVSMAPLMHRACLRPRSSAIVERLLALGAPVDIRNDDGETPLLAVCSGSRLDSTQQKVSLSVLDLLVRNKADINAADDRGATSLHHAVRGPFVEAVKRLLAAGANIDVRDNNGATPLCLSAASDSSLAALLIARGADVTIPNHDGDTPLHLAAQEGTLATVRRLLDAGAQINAGNDDGETALYQAASNDRFDAVELLMKKGAKLNASTNEGHTLVHLAATKGNARLLERSLAAGLAIDAMTRDGETPLALALSSDQPECACALVAKGANLAVADRNERTPLHVFADFSRSASCFSAIVAKAARIDAVDEEGLTPLMLAARHPTDHFAKLLAKGASLSARSHGGKTALMYAAAERQPNHVATALAGACNPNIRDKSGETALLLAAGNGDLASVQLLLSAGADARVRTEDGVSALDRALHSVDLQMVYALRRAGAVYDTTTPAFASLVDTTEYGYESRSELVSLLIRALTLPPDSLPRPVDCSVDKLQGVWYFAGTIPKARVSTGPCRLSPSVTRTLKTTNQLIVCDRHQVQTLSTHDYNLSRDSYCRGDTLYMDYRGWSYLRTADQLILRQGDEDDCRVYGYAGATVPAKWGERD